MGIFGLKWVSSLNVCILLLRFSFSTAGEAAVVTVDVHAAKGLLSSGHRYLDVRTVEEFKKGHLENSLNVPIMFFTPQGRVKNPEFVEQVAVISKKEDLILVGCQSGVRSLQASADLLNAGFENVKNVGGGIAAWLENGFPVKRTEDEKRVSDEPLAEEAATVDVRTASSLLSSGHRYLDVRTEEEFKKGHLWGSINVPYMFITPGGRVKNEDFVEQVSLVCDKEHHIVVGCQSGVRSLQATIDLQKAGFKNVKNMGGGYAAWVENGFGVKKLEDEL